MTISWKFTVEDIEEAIKTRTPIKSSSGITYIPSRLFGETVYCTAINFNLDNETPVYIGNVIEIFNDEFKIEKLYEKMGY